MREMFSNQKMPTFIQPPITIVKMIAEFFMPFFDSLQWNGAKCPYKFAQSQQKNIYFLIFSSRILFGKSDCTYKYVK
jgi:hypothetical protein